MLLVGCHNNFIISSLTNSGLTKSIHPSFLFQAEILEIFALVFWQSNLAYRFIILLLPVILMMPLQNICRLKFFKHKLLYQLFQMQWMLAIQVISSAYWKYFIINFLTWLKIFLRTALVMKKQWQQ